MTKNNTLRLALLALCLAAILTSVASCDKSVDKPVGAAFNSPAVEHRDTLFSRIKFYADGRKPGIDTVWTLRLTTHELVVQYSPMDGYVYAQSNVYADLGVLWTRKHE